ncbi:hypothetical protein BVX98_03275, partial [bacterium F11]
MNGSRFMSWGINDGTYRTIKFTGIDDDFALGDVSLDIFLSTTSGNITRISPETYELVFQDDESVAGSEFNFVKDIDWVNEDVGNIDAQILWKKGDAVLERLTLELINGSAEEGVDFINNDPLVRELNPSFPPQDDKIFKHSLNIINDGVPNDKGRKSFTIRVKDTTGNSKGRNDPNEIEEFIILDVNAGYTANPYGVFHLQDDFTVLDSTGTIKIIVERWSGTLNQQFLDYVVEPISAVEGTDYVPHPQSGTLVWPHTDGTDKDFSIDIIEFPVYQADKSFKVTFSNPVGGSSFEDPNDTEVVVTITSDDPVPSGSQLELQSDFSVIESTGRIKIKVNRTGVLTDEVRLGFSVSGGNATIGQDYTVNSGGQPLTWPSNVGGEDSFTI